MSLLEEISQYNPAQREIPTFPRQLLEYLPPVMRDVDEMEQIMQAEQPEVFDLWEAVQRVLNEQFIGTMSDYGVRRWEKILQVTPPAADTLDERKERILLILRMKLPYTVRWLRSWLDDNIGAGNYSLDIHLYTIQIELHYDAWPEWRRVFMDVLDLLGWVRPQNMVLGITGLHTVTTPVHIGGWNEINAHMEIGTNILRPNGGILLGANMEMQQCIEV